MAETIFHVVHSIKGGCGKTAFSLFKALEFATASVKADSNSDKARVLYLDADFKGTGLDVLIYAKNQDAFEGNREVRLDDLERGGRKLPVNAAYNYFLFRKKYNRSRLNDYLNREGYELQEIVTESGVVGKDSRGAGEDIEGVTAFNGYLDFIFSSSALKDRGYFAYQNEHQPVMTVGRFRIKMRNLLQQICDRTLVNGDKQYENIIIDMPAGYDEYSDVFLEVLHKFCKSTGKGKIYYYAVTTADRSHFDAMLEDVRDAEAGDRDCGEYEKIYVVFSETHKEESSYNVWEKYKARLEGEAHPQVELVRCLYQSDYNAFCRTDEKKCFSYELREIK